MVSSPWIPAKPDAGKFVKSLLPCLAALSLPVAGGLQAAVNAVDFQATPPLLQNSSTPRIMLLMSNDQQLYHKAYSDYSDLDSDGILDTSYNDDFDYYGYFNTELCYSYQNQRFEPTAATVSGHQCGGGVWSGNFLNWATMTRMDIVRRVYYGGKRIVDSDDETVLQRTLLPTDSHAFVKVYGSKDGEDVDKYTPYNYDEISLCNVTLASGSIQDVDESASPPLVRVVDGSFPQWAATELFQCLDQNDKDGDGGDVTKGDDDRPADVAADHDLYVRVLACSDTERNLAVADDCRAYGDGDATVYKPAGMLQVRGEDANVRFGLMTGTHEYKMSGGVLRRNIVPIAGNADATQDEIDLATGRFRYLDGDASFSGGIIETLDRMRIAYWDYDVGKYDECDSPGIKVDDYEDDNRCSDWGNPLAEIYLEALRYFAADGRTATTDFSEDVDDFLGLSKESWNDPLSANEYCAQCSIIVMSTGLNSFDGTENAGDDELGNASDLDGMDSLAAIAAKTDVIGDNEGIHGNTFMVANVLGGSEDNLCSPKNVDALSKVLGICPELPSLRGSFNLAGLTYWAQTTDLRTDAGMDEVQRINTYTVALAESLPSFLFNTRDGKSISIIPSCQSTNRGADPWDWSDCSIVDITVRKDEFFGIDGSEGRYVRLDIAWEDSLWGNDYDMDGISTIEICTAIDTNNCQYQPADGKVLDDLPKYQKWDTTPGNGEMLVRVSVAKAWAGYNLRFGVIVGGSVVSDGATLAAAGDLFTKFDNGDDVFGSSFFGKGWVMRPGGSYADTTNNYTCLYSECDQPAKMVWSQPLTLAASGETANFLNSPLWYAAKYGNFRNSDIKTLPTELADWDALDLDGNAIADGIPDAYFPVSNPAQLVTQLDRVLDDIEQKAASGTSVAVTLERRDGVGATFQAYYFPTYEDADGTAEVSWVGGLHALFLDGDLKLHEDSNGDGQLDAADVAINIYYDEATERTVVERLNADGTVKEIADFHDIEPIWDARDWLAALSDEQVRAQRNYSDSVGRYLFTWMDKVRDGDVVADGEVDADEVVDFAIADVVLKDGYHILGVDSVDAGSDLINYIRGDESIVGTRSRTVTLPGGNTPQPWRLGDIVNSSPIVVGAPGAGYDVDHADSSYRTFRAQYFDRRQVIYAGANDGMLHAFNAGFYNRATGFSTAGIDPISGEAVTEYALGAELWAYVPRNLLPHLRWLKDDDYPHVFYVDGEPRVYDVNIFTPSDTHPGGWGTILVVGFRFGGGEISLDLDNDDSDDFTSRSAYVILDITDPEQAPTLLAEITDPQLGFTTSAPALVKGRVSNVTTGDYDEDDDAWYLVFGSGPAGTDSATRAEALAKGVSAQNAYLYVYDLAARTFVDLDADATSVALDTGISNSFIGEAVVADWGQNYLDDVVYFGVVSGTDPATPTGSLQRLMFELKYEDGSAPVFTLADTATTTMLNPGKPFQGAPIIYRDIGARRQWVLAGTGRFLVAADNNVNYSNRFYGLLEPLDEDGARSYATVSEAALADTTDVAVLADNSVYDAVNFTTPATVLNDGGSELNAEVGAFSDLLNVTSNAGGWYNNLGTLDIDVDADDNVISSGESRNYNGALAIGAGVGFVKYAANESVCTPSGYSAMRFIDSRTGTASRNIFFLEVAVPEAFNNTGDTTLLRADSDVMQGAVSKLTLVTTNDGAAVGSSNNYGGIQFDPVGSLPPESARQSWRELPIYTDE